MFALRSTSKSSNSIETLSGNCTPNVLPCRIHYDGPIDASKRHWDAVKDEKGTIHHFLGLLYSNADGVMQKRNKPLTFAVANCRAESSSFQRVIRVGILFLYNSEYSILTFACFDVGVVALPTDRLVPGANRNGNIEEELPEEPVKVLESQATFEKFVVWGHEIPPAADDTFVKGVDEWIKLAEAV